MGAVGPWGWEDHGPHGDRARVEGGGGLTSDPEAGGDTRRAVRQCGAQSEPSLTNDYSRPTLTAGSPTHRRQRHLGHNGQSHKDFSLQQQCQFSLV